MCRCCVAHLTGNHHCSGFYARRDAGQLTSVARLSYLGVVDHFLQEADLLQVFGCGHRQRQSVTDGLVETWVTGQRSHGDRRSAVRVTKMLEHLQNVAFKRVLKQLISGA